MDEKWAQAKLASPTTTAQDLAYIASNFPHLAAGIAAHPNLYPALAGWLADLHRPEVDAALAARRSGGPYAAFGTASGSGMDETQGDQAETDRSKRPWLVPFVVIASAALVLGGAGTATWLIVRDGDGGTPTAGGSLTPSASASPSPSPTPSASPTPWAGDLGDPDVPNYTGQPTLGEPIDVNAALGGGFDQLTYIGAVDATHVLALGLPADSGYEYSDWYQGYDEDYEAGFADGTAYQELLDASLDCGYDETCPEYPNESDYYKGNYNADGYDDGWTDARYWEYGKYKAKAPTSAGGTVLGKIDLTTGEATWTASLTEASGYINAYVGCDDDAGYGQTILTEQGYFLTVVTDTMWGGYGSTASCAAILVGPNGDVVEKLTGVGSLLAYDGAVAAFTDGSDVTAFRLPGGQEVWQEAAPRGLSYSIGYPLEFADGTWAVPTKEGYVELATGKELGFGEHASDDTVYFAVGQAAIELTYDWESMTYDCEAMAYDAATGAEMWDEPLERVTTVVGGFEGDDGWVVVVSTSSGQYLKGFDLATGGEIWSKSIVAGASISQVDANTVAVAGLRLGQSISLYEATTGRQVWSVRSPGQGASVVLGTEVMYVATDDAGLFGYAVAQPGTQLWQADLPSGSQSEVLSEGGALLVQVFELDDYLGAYTTATDSLQLVQVLP
ncbi:MAG: PQQ-like beta-propeller repeat protein [Bifidobacteriaceae bacterium]|jgi:hypothetical protein|nr:PQQ-like beta-propeller repeat protein [Bifidobacteriaceae bacterium]